MKILRGLLLPLVLFGLAFGATELLERPPLDMTDQAEWATISVVHLRQLEGKAPSGTVKDRKSGDLHEDPWRQGVQATTFGWPNPGFHKLVWGLVCEPLAPERILPAVFLRYHQGDPARNQRAVMPLVPAIERAQVVVALASAACAVLLYLLARRLGGQVAGGVALLLWVAHPLVRTWSHQARPDFGMLALFLAVPLSVLVLLPCLRGERGTWRQLAAWCGAGLLAGLCAATKLNGALAGIFLAASVPLLLLTRDGQGARPRPGPLVAGAVAGGLLSASTLFALFPYLWSAPLEHLREVLDFWSEHMAFQQERWEAAGGTATRTLSEKVGLLGSRWVGRDEPLRAISGLPGGLLFLLAGLVLLGLRAAGRLESGSPEGRPLAVRVVLLWIAVTLVGTALWLPLEWDRYFFPAVAVGVLLEAGVAGWAVRALKQNRGPAPE